jgi:hypothetical protein
VRVPRRRLPSLGRRTWALWAVAILMLVLVLLAATR